jgi:prolipoprotein diacylglyceryl transferase
MAYLVAVLVAVAIVRRRWAARGGDPALVQDVALVGFPAGIVGGRLYFLATSWNEVPDHWWGPLAVWHGGLGIWGGIAGGTLAGLWVLRRRGADIPAFLDAAAPALLVAQAIGRIGNYFNQELFGGPTSLPWGLEIDAAHRPAAYAHYATFHPTFLYELIWNLVLAAALVALGRRRAVRPPGLFALYVAGYSGFRIFEETLRVDPAHHLFGLRLNLFVAALLFLAGLIWFVRTQRRDLPMGLELGGPATQRQPEQRGEDRDADDVEDQLVVGLDRTEDVRARRAGAARDQTEATEDAVDDQRGNHHRHEHQRGDAEREAPAVVLPVDRNDRQHDQVGEEKREHATERDPAGPQDRS